jgi:hypothetical protein
VVDSHFAVSFLLIFRSGLFYIVAKNAPGANFFILQQYIKSSSAVAAGM